MAIKLTKNYWKDYFNSKELDIIKRYFRITRKIQNKSKRQQREIDEIELAEASQSITPREAFKRKKEAKK